MFDFKNLLLTFIRLVQLNNMEKRFWFHWFAERVGKPDSILDVCSAYGHWFYGLLRRDINLESYIGIDINNDYLKQGSYLSLFFNHKKSCFQYVDVSKGIPFKDNTFSQVWMMSWWVSSNCQFVLDESHRVLKKDGILFLMIPDWLPQLSLNKFKVNEQTRFCGFDKVWHTLYKLTKC
jgi:ubiquinone/menaquinone biosynthesis C-methylase UbiE